MATDPDIMPADAPMPVRARAPKTKAEEAALTSAPPFKAGGAFLLNVFVGTDTPVTLKFSTKEAREKACTCLAQRVNRLATVIPNEGKVYTFIYVTHFVCEE
jgi:hypothetical protein